MSTSEDSNEEDGEKRENEQDEIDSSSSDLTEILSSVEQSQIVLSMDIQCLLLEIMHLHHVRCPMLLFPVHGSRIFQIRLQFPYKTR